MNGYGVIEPEPWAIASMQSGVPVPDFTCSDDCKRCHLILLTPMVLRALVYSNFLASVTPLRAVPACPLFSEACHKASIEFWRC